MRTGEGEILMIVFSLMNPGEGSLPGHQSLHPCPPSHGATACHNSCRRDHAAHPRFLNAARRGGRSEADNTFWKHRTSCLIAPALRRQCAGLSPAGGPSLPAWAATTEARGEPESPVATHRGMGGYVRPGTCQAWPMATSGSRGTWCRRSCEQGKEPQGPAELFLPPPGPMAAAASSYCSCCPFPAAQPGG